MFEDHKHKTFGRVLLSSPSSRLLRSLASILSSFPWPFFSILDRCCLGSLPSLSFSQWFDGFTLVALLLWRCGGWKALSFMRFLMENEVFFGRLKVLCLVDVWFPFGVYGCAVKVRLLWGFWWKGKTFYWFNGLGFCWGMIFVRGLGLWCLNIFVSSMYGAEKYGLCAHFENVFHLNEWWVGVLVDFL